VGIMSFESSRAFLHWEVGRPSKCRHCSSIKGNSSPDSSHEKSVSIISLTPELSLVSQQQLLVDSAVLSHFVRSHKVHTL